MPTVFHGDGRGGFTRQADSVLGTPSPLDTAGIVGLNLGGGRREVVVGIASQEDPGSQRPRARVRVIGAPDSESLLPEAVASSGPVVVGSVGGPGSLVLFVGGRSIPGRYPEAADSALWVREGDHWKASAAANEVLRSAGLVSGAVFTDLDEDGNSELVLACDWGVRECTLGCKVFRWIRPASGDSKI